MQRIVLASGNAGKLSELRDLLSGQDIEWIAQSELGITDVAETGLSFVENAVLKARHASRHSGLPALADDSGLCVDALQGAPGLYSARYAGSQRDDAANSARLLAELRDVADAQRTAHFHCSIVLMRHAEDPAPLIAEGRWHGRILTAPRGSRGFGYDPLFLDLALNASAAELDAVSKHRVSHRGQALALLRQRLGCA